jgi:hypothetical protein
MSDSINGVTSGGGDWLNLESRIAELEVQLTEFRLKGETGNSEDCTNGCTYGCTHGCTHGCTGAGCFRLDVGPEQEILGGPLEGN